jgi:hypothetical protein
MCLRVGFPHPNPHLYFAHSLRRPPPYPIHRSRTDVICRLPDSANPMRAATRNGAGNGTGRRVSVRRGEGEPVWLVG